MVGVVAFAAGAARIIATDVNPKRLELARLMGAHDAVLPADAEAAIAAAVAEVGATSIRDMGKVMAVLKAKYTGQMDFGAVGPRIKDRLG